MKKYYCKNCGIDADSVINLLSSKCSRHPAVPFQGAHQLYEGTEKAKYACKYCGITGDSIKNLTSARCQQRSRMIGKPANHVPAL